MLSKMGEHLFLLLLLAIVSSLVQINSVTAINPKSAGFTLRMIHRDSKESPLYPGDHLTRLERFQRLVQQSKQRSRYVESQILHQNNATASSINPDFAMPVVYEASMWYVADVALGTFMVNGRETFKHYYLMIDSGSDITWLQCEGASPSFRQDDPLYPYRQSRTYVPVPCRTHPLCRDGACSSDGKCTFNQTYANGATASGVLASETFTVNSYNGGGSGSISLFVGCGFNQQNFDGILGKNHQSERPDLIAGILGLGVGSWSFINLLGPIGEGKFSYCLEKFDSSEPHGSDTFLRFGIDATIGGDGQQVHTTPVVVPDFRTSLYYLYLEDVSVGDVRVGFVREDFELRRYGRGGSFIDSGNPWSYMYKDHFDRVASLVLQHFARHDIVPIEPAVGIFPLCFHIPPEWDDPAAANYPSITFHFEGASFVVSGVGAAFVDSPYGPEHGVHACLGIATMENPDGPGFVLGALQQTNKKILYNLRDRSLSFADQDCLQDL